MFVIPAQAGNQNTKDNWFPACAGMTGLDSRKVNSNTFPIGQYFQHQPLCLTLTKQHASISVHKF
jgi:hypothetical protein